MKRTYFDLVDQTFDFPQAEFKLSGANLLWNDIDLEALLKEYGSPLRVTYLPAIDRNIQLAKKWFRSAMVKANYHAEYHYCYCTKSSHFKHVIERCLDNSAHLETSSELDLHLILDLFKRKKLSNEKYVICNGFKTEGYVRMMAKLMDEGFTNIIPVIDYPGELQLLDAHIKDPISVGIRIASEEEPKFEFYTSRLGIGYKDIRPFYLNHLKDHPKFRLKMLHFFINGGIRDNAYYWNELGKCNRVYASLKMVCDSLDSLNIGGGFPIKRNLGFEYDYKYMVQEIIDQVKSMADEQNFPEPHIFSEFGSYTVGESGALLYSIVEQKTQNDREKWNMINGSFMTSLPDTWAIGSRFIMLPLNRWNDEYERVMLGGMTCDSDDYYNAEQHINAIYLPKYSRSKPLHIGFFNMGAYQENISGYGGIKHCLIPAAKHILIDHREGEMEVDVFKEQQDVASMMQVLGYDN